MARCDESIIFFECKFKELDGGTCDQCMPSQKSKLVRCDGNYKFQVNPENGRESRCALTGKGIKYWEVIPDLFRLESTIDYEPCRFSGSNYQWMRNLVVCTKVARKKGLSPHFMLVYADGPGLPIAEKIRADNLSEFRSLLKDGSVFSCMSYQNLLIHSIESVFDEKEKFSELSRWINEKIKSQIGLS